MTSLDLRTRRLLIRPFIADDLHEIHRILSSAFGSDTPPADLSSALEDRRAWLQWAALGQTWATRMHQPPYGDRAVVLMETGRVIGAVGLVPLLDVFDQIPELRRGAQPTPWATAEVGLFWAIDPAHQRKGYATEAASALIEHAFRQLRLHRILATTEYDNHASQSVMRKLGLRLTRNPLPEPVWLQVVGVLDNPFAAP